jgi:Polyketide cyclase / dehydrase and lipid transport
VLERLADLSRAGDFTNGGYPKPLAAAGLIDDFPHEGRAAQPPAALQRAFARVVLASRGEYVFVDQWEVDAPAEAVFRALADATTYPEWWRPVYLDVETDGPLAVGQVSDQHFKGRLPYHLHTRSRIVRLEPPHVVEAHVDGDLRGRGTWTLTQGIRKRTPIRFDWVVFADKPILRVLTPMLRPAFRWNHAWAIARTMEGLEPYARATAAASNRLPADPEDVDGGRRRFDRGGHLARTGVEIQLLGVS